MQIGMEVVELLTLGPLVVVGTQRPQAPLHNKVALTTYTRHSGLVYSIQRPHPHPEAGFAMKSAKMA